MNSDYKFFVRNKDGKFEQFTYEMAIETLQNQSRYIDQLRDRIDKAIKDLELTREYNREENNLLQIDVGHLNYLIRILKGDEQDETNNN